MSKLQTNLLGRRATVNEEHGPFPEGGPVGKRVGIDGEIVTARYDAGNLLLGVLWPDGQITTWNSDLLTVQMDPSAVGRI